LALGVQVTVLDRPATATGERRPVRALSVWGWVLALGPPVTVLAYMATTDRVGRLQVLNDDAYYYLGVARSIVDGDGSTFTGLTETNGYHPLWQLLMVPLALITRDLEGLATLVVLVQGVIWIALVREAFLVARQLGSEILGIAAVAALGLIAVVTEHVSFNGMESGLVLFLLVLAMRLGVQAGDDPSPRVDWTVGVVLALAFLTRLDAILVTAPMALVMYRRDRPTTLWLPRRATALLGPTAVALAVYLMVNQALFGTPTPVSGQAKGLGAPYLNLQPLRNMLDAGDILGHSAYLGAISFVTLAAAWALGEWRERTATRQLMYLACAVAAGQALFIAYMTFGTSYGALPWYHYNTALLLFCTGLLLADWCAARLRSMATSLCLVAGGFFLLLQGVGVLVLTHNAGRVDASEAAGELARSELPEDAVLAMGDRAGLFGLVADRPLLQLEGLMADEAFLHDLEHGSVLRRMADDGVDYYARYSPRSDRPLDGRDCWQLREPTVSRGPSFEVTVCQADLVHRRVDGDNELTIWRFRPELNRG
jgi:hypothetical protein